MTHLTSRFVHFTTFFLLAITISSVSGDLSDLLSRLTKTSIDKNRPIVLILDKEGIPNAAPAPPLVNTRTTPKPKVSNNVDIETLLKDLLKLQKKPKSLMIKSNRKITRSKSDRSKYENDRSSFWSRYDDNSLSSRLRSSYNGDGSLISNVQPRGNIGIPEKVNLKGTGDNMKSLAKQSTVVKSLLVLRNRISCNARDECQDKCENKRKKDQCEDKCEMKHDCEPEVEDLCEDDECAPSDDSCEGADCSGSTRAPPLPETKAYCPSC